VLDSVIIDSAQDKFQFNMKSIWILIFLLFLYPLDLCARGLGGIGANLI